MSLNINNYWVHFDAVRADGSILKPEALFPAMAKQDNNRYLKIYTRDFFYVMAKYTGSRRMCLGSYRPMIHASGAVAAASVLFAAII